MKTPHRLSDEDFAHIYSMVPRLNVDLIVRTADGGVVLIKRSIEPHIGAWHVPGGTVYKEERMYEAAVRVAKNETGFDVVVDKQLGFMEFPFEKRGDLMIHTISIVIEVKVVSGELKQDTNAKEINIFYKLPEEDGIPEHFTFLQENGVFEK